jgi:predicted RND superfamily exporter protein
MLLVTVFMGWRAWAASHEGDGWLSFKYARVLPADDPMYQSYEAFKKRFGEDGNVMVLGFRDTGMFDLAKYQGWYDLTETVRGIDSVENVLSTARLYRIVPNDSIEKFGIEQVVTHRPTTQAEADSIKELINDLPFYDGLIINKDEHVTLMAITFNQGALNSKYRLELVQQIHNAAAAFGSKYHEEIHYSGMPWIRSEYMRKISGESVLFLLLSIGITALILFIFFRYFNAVFFSLIVVIVGLAWSLGTIALFGYKITILTGLIPSLIVIIGIPNCIFLINKYQEELLIHGNKTKALGRMVQKVGLSNFLANLTTSIGFGVFYFTNSEMLVQFGIVAAINVMTTYAIAIVLTPIIFSYLPVPKPKQMKHLSGKRINKLMDWVDNLVHNHRRGIYLGVAIVTVISIIGFKFVTVKGYVVDDLPKNDPIYTDLKFFEKYFHGVVPFEVAIEVKQIVTPKQFASDSLYEVVKKQFPEATKADVALHYTTDTLAPKNIFDQEGNVLVLVDSLQNVIGRRPQFSRPLSVVEAAKFCNQGLYRGKPQMYRLPNNSGAWAKLATYLKPEEGDEKANALKQQKLTSFLDTTYRHTRISFQMADVGSDSAALIRNQIQPQVNSIFPSSQYNVQMTGFSLMFLRSFDYMLHHLFVSLLIAIVSILLLGMVLFRSVWIIVLSKLPCLIPLVITAGIMGFLGIPFKSSTILIFSIAFGIASDGTIYILTEYRQQLRRLSPANASQAVSRAIHETGLSMIYTNTILFFGFAIFILSGFGGTVALGILLSITLLVSLATNLILLPCILLSLEKRSATKALLQEPLIEIYDEEEDIDSEKLTIHKEH